LWEGTAGEDSLSTAGGKATGAAVVDWVPAAVTNGVLNGRLDGGPVEGSTYRRCRSLSANA